MDKKLDSKINTKKNEIRYRGTFVRLYGTNEYSNYQNHVEISSCLRKMKPKRGEVILDCGCGTGRISYELLKRGCKVVALDFSKESLKVCEERCKTLGNSPHHIIADVSYLPLKEEIFSKCISSEVFEHIPSQEYRVLMLKEIHRTLKPGGKLLLTTYNYNLRKWISNKKEGYQKGKIYYYRYNYLELRDIISSVFGGKIKISGTINLVPWIPIKIVNTFKRLSSSLDRIIEKTPFSYLLGQLLSVECKKSQAKPHFLHILLSYLFHQFLNHHGTGAH